MAEESVNTRVISEVTNNVELPQSQETSRALEIANSYVYL